MNLVKRLVLTVIGLVGALAVFLHAFITGAITFVGGIQIYPNGTDWVCVIGFALLSLPAMIEIVRMIVGAIRGNNQILDENRTATVYYDEDDRVEDVRINDNTAEKFLLNGGVLIFGGVLIWFLGFFLAVGFTLYRIGVLIYCIVKLKTDSGTNGGFRADPKSVIDNKMTPKRNIFKDVENIGQLVKISAKDLQLFQSPNAPQFTVDWTLKLQDNQRIRIFRQGISLSVTDRDEECGQILYAVRVVEDCPNLNKQRGDLAFLLMTYSKKIAGQNKTRYNLYYLQGDGEQVAYEYYDKNVISPENRQIYSKGKYPYMIYGRDGTVYSIRILDTAKYKKKEYGLVLMYEPAFDIPADQSLIIEIKKGKGKEGATVQFIIDIDYATEINDACFSQYFE